MSDSVVTIGRGPGAAMLDDITASRRHAEFCPAPEGYRLVDLGSLNGTYLHDVRVDQAPLADGDVLQIGLLKPCLLRRPLISSSPGHPSPGRA